MSIEGMPDMSYLYKPGWNRDGSYTWDDAIQLHAYSSGTIMQTSTASIEIDLTGATGGQLAVSDFIDIEVTRDTDNTSTLFAGADPLTGNALLKAFDIHLQQDASGSMAEYEKTY